MKKLIFISLSLFLANIANATTDKEWSSICDKRGEKLLASYYDDRGELVQEVVTVGQKETDCFGRCGPKCGHDGSGEGRYTQECLNHDLCHRRRDEYLGACKEEMLIAVHGFFMAPKCES